MGRRILRHTYRSRALIFVVDVARGERSEEDASRSSEGQGGVPKRSVLSMESVEAGIPPFAQGSTDTLNSFSVA